MLSPPLRDWGQQRHGLILRNIARLVEENKHRPPLDEGRFNLETAPDAFHRVASGKTQGKVVIDIPTRVAAVEVPAIVAAREKNR
jgi:NADPH2:quinone reductase